MVERRHFDTAAAVFADTRLAYTPGGAGSIAAGQIVWARLEGFSWEIAASGATDHHLATAGGIKLYVRPTDEDTLVDAAFGTDLASLQAALDAAAGKELVVTRAYTVTTPLTVDEDDVTLRFSADASLTYTDPESFALIVHGARCTIYDIRVTAPAPYSGANESAAYAVVWITGAAPRLYRPKITNVPKCGIYLDGVNDWHIIDPIIDGGLDWDNAVWNPGVTTNLAAITADARGDGNQGNGKLRGGYISRVIQGALLSDLGQGAAPFSVANGSGRAEGYSVIGTTFTDCLDHGVYLSGGLNNGLIEGNTFIRCHVPIACDGQGHAVIGNVMSNGGLAAQGANDWRSFVGISMRDPINCVVANNVIRGIGKASGTVVGFENISGNVVRGNVCSGNVIEVTGGSAFGVLLGTSTATDLSNNKITDNVVISSGRDGGGIIDVIGASAGCDAWGTVVSGNSTVATTDAHGVRVVNVTDAKVINNEHELRYDAGSAITLRGFWLSGCSDCEVSDNKSRITAAWGTNVDFVNVEESGTSSGNRAARNSMSADLTKLDTATRYVMTTNTDALVDDYGTGDPNTQFHAGVGSRWMRTDGGAGTTLYVKEGTGSSNWVAK